MKQPGPPYGAADGISPNQTLYEKTWADLLSPGCSPSQHVQVTRARPDWGTQQVGDHRGV